MKRILLLIFLHFGIQPLWADPVIGEPQTGEELRQNVYGFRDWLIKNLQFPKGTQRRFASVAGGIRRPFTSAQYNEAFKSDWVKCQVMNGLATLSEQLSKTVGTAFAPSAVSQLQGYAVQLQGSDDPDFQRIGNLYQQEAQAIQSGNVAATDQAWAQISALPRPSVAPGYQPSSQESALVSAFNQVIGTAIAALGGVIGSLVVSQILSSLGIQSLGSLVGLGQNTGYSIANGNPGQAANNAGVAVIQTGGSAAIQQLGTVNLKPRQSQDSANAGGAPPAQ